MTPTINPFLPKSEYIVVERYYKAENPTYEGNPLITLFPALTPEILSTLMTSDVKVSPHERFAPTHLRIQYVMNLMRLYWPQLHHCDFAWKLWSLICQGLSQQNPTRQPASLRFNSMCEGVAAGNPAPDTEASFLDSEWCAVLIGTPGVGKSATSRALLDRLGAGLFYHPQYGIFQVLSIRVQASKNATGKGLALQIFKALSAEARKTGHYFPFSGRRPPSTLPELEDVIVDIARALHLGALVIDELQHLYRGTGAMDHEAMKFLTGLVNRLRLPLVLIGTWKCLDLLTLEARVSRRALSPASAYFRKMPEDETWANFFGMLLLKQYMQQPTDDENGELAKSLYYHCQGIQDVAVKLWVIAQIEAMADETEKLTPELLDRVAATHLPILAPWIGHMQKGSSENNPYLYDAEPVDFDKYLESLRAKAVIRASRSRTATSQPSGVAPLTAHKVAEAIVAAELTDDPQAALRVAADAVNSAPGASAADHLAKVLKDTAPKGPRPTKSTKPQVRKAVAEAFAGLPPGDIRRIVFEAVQGKGKPGDALEAAGYVANVVDDLGF